MNQDEHQSYSWSKQHLMYVLTSGKKPKLSNPRLIQAFQNIDRMDFVDSDFDNKNVYADSADQLGQGQIMESPVYIAEILEKLNLESGLKVLEIGTGSGYVTAILAETVKPGGFVYSLERSQRFLQQARKNVANYKLNNLEFVFQNAEQGLVSKAPFDRIYSSVSYTELPETILGQLSLNGQMILPLSSGEVKLITRLSDEDFEEQLISFQELKVSQLGVV